MEVIFDYSVHESAGDSPIGKHTLEGFRDPDFETLLHISNVFFHHLCAFPSCVVQKCKSDMFDQISMLERQSCIACVA